MEYAEFAEGVKEGRLRYSIDKNAAGFLYGQVGLIPQGMRRRQANTRALAYGLSALGVVLFFFVPWYFALLSLGVGFYQSRRAQKLAESDVAELVTRSPAVFAAALSNKAIKVQSMGMSRSMLKS